MADAVDDILNELRARRYERQGYDMNAPDAPTWLLKGAKKPDAPAEGTAPVEYPRANVDELVDQIRKERANEMPAVAPGSPFEGAKKPTPAESAVRKALQFATLGNADEASAAIDTAIGKLGYGPPVNYEQRRDEYRARNRQAEIENPKASAIGAVGGLAASMVTKAPASVAGAVLRGAGTGAASGFGFSEAPTIGGVARDTAVGAGAGAVIGGAFGALGQRAATAPARLEKKEIDDLLLGTQGKTRTTALGRRGENEREIREVLKTAPEVQKTVREQPSVALEAVEKRIEPLSKRADEYITRSMEVTPGVPVPKAVAGLRELEREYGQAQATKPLAAEVKRIADGIVEDYGKTNVVKGVGHVPLDRLKGEYRRLQDLGYQGLPQFSTPAGKELKQRASKALREPLMAELERVTTRNPSIGSIHELQRLNREMSSWIRVKDVLEEKATREIAGAGTFGKIIADNSLRAAARQVLEATGEKLDQAFANVIVKARAGDGKASAVLKSIYDLTKAAYRPAAKGAVIKGAKAPIDVAQSWWQPAYADRGSER